MKSCDKRQVGITYEQAVYINDLLEDEKEYQEESDAGLSPMLADLISTIDDVLGTFKHTGHIVVGPDEDGAINVCCNCFDECEFELEQEIGRLIDGNGDTVPCELCGTAIG